MYVHLDIIYDDLTNGIDIHNLKGSEKAFIKRMLDELDFESEELEGIKMEEDGFGFFSDIEKPEKIRIIIQNPPYQFDKTVPYSKKKQLIDEAAEYWDKAKKVKIKNVD